MNSDVINKSVLVTIGIPIYNVEPYIEKCLLSVLNQTYHNLEIIIVDDCGTDHSMDIVLRIAKLNPYGNLIRMIKQTQNKGVSEARNAVIENAKGQYLYFLDGDDFIEPQTIEVMLNQSELHVADVVYASARTYIMQTKSYSDCFSIPEYKIVSGKENFAKLVCMNLRQNVSSTSWNILFRMQFIKNNNLRFFGRNTEDFLFFSTYYSKVEKAVFIPDITYNYVIREKSLMGYNIRNSIPVCEIRERLLVDQIMTQRCVSVKGCSFYDVHCARVMKHKFRAVCVALKLRHHFTEWLTDKEIHKELEHPATLSEIIGFKQYFFFNLLFYIVDHLPPFVSVKVCHLVGKIAHWI